MTDNILHTLAAALFGGLAVAVAFAAPEATTVMDRDSFIPKAKFRPLPGKVVGLLLSDIGPKMAHEGRFGAPENLAFSSGGASYRWVYVPGERLAQINSLKVPVGEKGERTQVYRRLSLANPRTLAQFDIKVPFALVEVEVNDGQGSPATEGFVATRMTRLDGSKEYPLNVADLMTELPKKYAAWKAQQQEKLDEAMTAAQKKAIGDRKATGPRQTRELIYATWLPETKRMRVHFRTTVSDGEFKTAPGGAPPKESFAVQQPPRALTGTAFGIEFGLGYEVSAEGQVIGEVTLPPQAFKTEVGPPRRPRQ